MRWTKSLIPTLKEDPAEAEAVSHRLMVRAGLVRQLAAGIYVYLPLGQRVMDKINAIIREEMNRIGGRRSPCRSCTRLSCGSRPEDGRPSAMRCFGYTTGATGRCAWE